MSVIKQIPPPTETPPFVPCEGVLKHYPYLTEEYKKRRAASLRQTGDYHLCGRRSTYMVDGKYYCKVHAGDAALTYLLEQEEPYDP
jgi:hypothetical protein